MEFSGDSRTRRANPFVDSLRTDRGVHGLSSGEDEGGEGVEDAEARVEPRRGVGQAIIQVGELGAEPTNVGWNSRERSPQSGFVAENEHFLSLSQSEHGNQDAAFPVKGGVDGGNESLLLDGPDESRFRRGIAARAFDDECVDARLGKPGCAGHGLVLEIYVAGVEDGVVAGSGQNARRSEDMPGIEEFEGGLGIVIDAKLFAVERPSLVQGAAPPAPPGDVDFAVGEKRVALDVVLLPDLCHDIHRVMEHHVGKLACGVGAEYGRVGLSPHQDRDRADVVLVGVRDDHCVHGIGWKQIEAGQGEFALPLGVKTGVEDDSLVANFEEVAVGTNLRVPREIRKSYRAQVGRT